jgi:hypothetical protein
MPQEENVTNLIAKCSERDAQSANETFHGRSSVNIADLLCKKKYPMEMHGRSQENGLRFETLGRNVMLTWSQLILKTPVAIAVTAAVGCSFAQLASRQSDWNPTSTRCMGSFGAKRGDKLGNGRNVYG